MYVCHTLSEIYEKQMSSITLNCCINTCLVIPQHPFCDIVSEITNFNLSIISKLLVCIIWHVLLFLYLIMKLLVVLRMLPYKIMQDEARLHNATQLLVGIRMYGG